MLRFARWKIISILSMTALAFLVIVPSLLGPATRDALIAHSPKWLPVRAIVLGLDLQGGSHVLLEVDSPSVVKTMVDNLRDSIRRVLRDEKISISGGIGVLPRGVQLRIPDPAELQRVLPKLRELVSPASVGLGGGGLSGGAPIFDISTSSDGLIQFTVTEAGVKAKLRRAVEQSIEVLRRRVDALGTTEPTIQREGDDRILVQVPGLQDPAAEGDPRQDGEARLPHGRSVDDPEQAPDSPPTDSKCSTARAGSKYLIEKRVLVSGADLVDAQPGFDQRTQRADRQLPLQLRGAPQVRRGDRSRMSASRSPSCSTTR